MRNTLIMDIDDFNTFFKDTYTFVLRDYSKKLIHHVWMQK